MRVHQTQTDYLLEHNYNIITNFILCLAMIRNIQEAVSGIKMQTIWLTCPSRWGNNRTIYALYWRRTLIDLWNILNYQLRDGADPRLCLLAKVAPYISVNILQFIVYNNSFIKWLSRWVFPIGVLSTATCGHGAWTGRTTSGRSRCQVRHTV